MSRLNRAAQFSPFAALTGYDDLVRESARTTDQKIELSEDALADINARLRLIQEHISEHPQISVTYFVADPVKNGGAYLECAGAVLKINAFEQQLVMEDGSEIPFADIISISGALFADFDDGGLTE